MKILHWLRRVLFGAQHGAEQLQPAAESWTDDSREYLRNAISSEIAGALRFCRATPSEIVQTCREVYIEEDAPQSEWKTFVSFAESELSKRQAEHDAEKRTWPELTDCDRLDAAESALLSDGIMLWQASPCCDSCTNSELPDRVKHLERLHPGISKKLRGYAFFIDQNMTEYLADGPDIDVYLAYGRLREEDDVDSETYEEQALSIGHQVVKRLEEADLKTHWDGDFSRKIGLTLTWQRRKLLT